MQRSESEEKDEKLQLHNFMCHIEDKTLLICLCEGQLRSLQVTPKSIAMPLPRFRDASELFSNVRRVLESSSNTDT